MQLDVFTSTMSARFGGAITLILLLANPVSALPIFGGSALLNDAHGSALEGWYSRYFWPMPLLQSFTKKSGSTSVDFHDVLDNQGSNLVVLEAIDASGNLQLIGGFTPHSWTSCCGYYQPPEGGRTAFLFNLTTNTVLYQKRTGPYASHQMYQAQSFGPTFGGGFDLFIDGSLTAGSAYQHTFGGTDINQTGGLNVLGVLGLSHFAVGRLEVFTIAYPPGYVPEQAIPEPRALVLSSLGLLIAIRRSRRSRRAVLRPARKEERGSSIVS